MRRLGIALALVVVGASCGSSSSKDAQSPRLRKTAKDIVNESSDGIVRIEAGLKGKDKDRVGTGFVVDSSGLIATNLHVIAGSDDIMIKLHDGSSHQVVELASADPERDLALLRIKPPKPLKVLRIGDSEKMAAGDQVTAIGNPLGVFDYTVSAGLVSAVRQCGETSFKCPSDGKGLYVLQTTAPISQGSSGGPLFNQFGEVIGVTTLIVNVGQAINLAMPASYIKPMVARPRPINLDDFAKATMFAREANEGGDAGDLDAIPITRVIPDHPLSVLDGCTDQQIAELVDAIDAAIKIGAPLYNQKTAAGMEACFRVYEGTATKLEQQPPCAGVGKAFGDGLLRASTLASYKEKAWAMRDTFDGLIKVATRKARAGSAQPRP